MMGSALGWGWAQQPLKCALSIAFAFYPPPLSPSGADYGHFRMKVLVPPSCALKVKTSTLSSSRLVDACVKIPLMTRPNSLVSNKVGCQSSETKGRQRHSGPFLEHVCSPLDLQERPVANGQWPSLRLSKRNHLPPSFLYALTAKKNV